MDDVREPGQLLLEGPGLQRSVYIYWQITSGELKSGNPWIAAVSFSWDYRLPEGSTAFVFQAMDTPDTRLMLDTGEILLECVIYEILELIESGVVEIADPSLGALKLGTVHFDQNVYDFVNNPPATALVKTRENGNIVIYDPISNTLASKTPDGTPTMMIHPDPEIHGYPTNMDYFNAFV